MSLFNPNVPTGFVNLDVDYQNLQNNNMQLDTSFGVDHYKFSNQTANNGFHNQVTNPEVVNTPPDALPPSTTAAINRIYAYTIPQVGSTAPIGLIQYSRGVSNAIPTPLTSMQSPSTPLVILMGNTTNVIDFTGLTRCAGILTTWDMQTTGVNKVVETLVIWDNARIFTQNIVNSGGDLQVVTTGNILQVKNATFSPSLANVYWTFKFYRNN